MSRRRKAVKRPVMPDPKFKDLIVSNFAALVAGYIETKQVIIIEQLEIKNIDQKSI